MRIAGGFSMYRWGRGLGQLLCQQYLLPMRVISWEEAQVEDAGLTTRAAVKGLLTQGVRGMAPAMAYGARASLDANNFSRFE